MSLAQKTLIILSLTVVALTAVLYATTRTLMLQNFLGLEQRETRTAVARVESALNGDISKLAASANDYGAWDRTYAFMWQPSSNYIQQEFKNETLQGLSVNSVLLMDRDGKIVFFKNYNSLLQQETEAPEVQGGLASDPWLQMVEMSSTPRSGILLLPGGPVLIAACPILTSERKGPERGVLVMTRNLDHELVAGLKSETHSSFSVELTSNPMLPHDLQTAKITLQSNPADFAVQPLSDQLIAGYALVKDIHGKPALMLKLEMPRTIFQEGLASLRYFLVARSLLSLGFGAVVLLLLRYLVLNRLTHLTAEVGRIGEQRDLTQRVHVTGSDELSKLGGTINSMLDALQNGDTQFREIAENIHQVFWVKDENTQEISYISPPWESNSGLTREGLYADSRTWLKTIHSRDRDIVSAMLEKQRRGEKGEAEFRIVQPDGTVWWSWCRYFPVFNETGQLMQTVGLSEDITEYKNAEETLLRSQDDLWNVMATAAKQSP